LADTTRNAPARARSLAPRSRGEAAEGGALYARVAAIQRGGRRRRPRASVLCDPPRAP